MRCQQVREQLEGPVRPARLSDLSAHLADCPSCAAVAEQVRRLNQIWAETRPSDPTDIELGRTWTQVARALDSGEQRDRFPRIDRSGRLRRFGLMASLATAAGLLGLLVGRSQVPPSAPEDGGSKVVRIEPATLAIEVNPDQMVYIRLGSDGPEKIVLDAPSTNPESYPALVGLTPNEFIGALETLAE